MKKLDSNIIDLLKNEYFVQWVIAPTDESMHYWSKWLVAHPNRKPDVALAKQLINSGEYAINEKMPEQHYSHVLENIVSYSQERKIKGRKSVSISWNNLRIAASILLVITIGIFTKYYSDITEPDASSDISTVTKFTEWGQKRIILLPDGSEVKLNSGSTIIFPKEFLGNNREVELIGEAFFDILKNPEKPFIVKTKSLNTIVLGTSFNVSAYSYDQTTLVTLLEGKVNVMPVKSEASSSTEQLILIPGEQASLDLSSGRFSKKEVELKEHLGWKDGVLYFNREPLNQVFTRLSKWYGVEFDVSDQLLKANCRLDGEFNNESLETVLKSISVIYDFEYEFKNKKMIRIRGETTCD